MKQFISWRRVSTKKQGKSGLGLAAQMDIINYFIKSEGGELLADYSEVYTGTELSGCTELKKAIEHCKQSGATLIIAKTDRLRNVREALDIVEQVGEGNIFFCDLPHTDKFTLTLFFAISEREALLISLRTKAALTAKKERGEVWNKEISSDRINKAVEASAKSRREKAKINPKNVFFWQFCINWQKKNGKFTAMTDFQPIADELNSLGQTTATGLPFTKNRVRAAYNNLSNFMI